MCFSKKSSCIAVQNFRIITIFKVFLSFIEPYPTKLDIYIFIHFFKYIVSHRKVKTYWIISMTSAENSVSNGIGSVHMTLLFKCLINKSSSVKSGNRGAHWIGCFWSIYLLRKLTLSHLWEKVLMRNGGIMEVSHIISFMW